MQLSPFLLEEEVNTFFLREIARRGNLVPFSLGEHGWGYHFVSYPGKVLFSLGHLN